MPADENQGPSKHLLAVGMPVYNGARWLEQSIESILSQSFTDFELFIADNASSDETGTICRRYAEADPRVRYHRHARNRGALKNYNDVFGMTASKYFKWASCSDICKPSLFERCIEILEARDEVVLAYAQTVLFSSISGGQSLFYQNLTLEDDSPSDRIRVAFDWLEGLNNAYNGVFRRSALNNMMPYREARGFDINMMLEMSLYGKFVEVEEPLFHRRFDPESTGEKLAHKEQVSFFGADNMEFGPLQRASRQLDRFAMPFRTPIPLAEKLRIELELMYRSMWLGPALARRLISLARRVWGKIY
ncbi:MAG: glycosyltransferase [Gammaproteobacteria bacterium]|nr:glycosyltransferase [Gammaproteobacteria bacterium]